MYNSDGVVRSGTFVCIHSQLERLKTEGVVDVFQAIKSARIHRPGIIHNTVCPYKYIIVFSVQHKNTPPPPLKGSLCVKTLPLPLSLSPPQRITMCSVMKYWLDMLRRWKCMQTLKLSFSNFITPYGHAVLLYMCIEANVTLLLYHLYDISAAFRLKLNVSTSCCIWL